MTGVQTCALPISVTQCYISGDNQSNSSVDITDARYDGLLSGDLARIGYLNASTTYYLNCTSSVTDWGYLTVKTNAGGIDEMELSITILFVFLGILFIVSGIILLIYKQNKRELERGDD